MRIGFNCVHPELFLFRFKREPKYWTIDQLHDLWLRACERAEKRQSNISNYIKEITREIPKNDREQHIVYFRHRNDETDNIHQYEFKWHYDWKGYGVSNNRVELKTRDEKLTFILANDKPFEMGQRYHELEYMRCKLQHFVKHYLDEMVEKELQNHFKKLNTNPPDVFIWKIGSRNYFVELDSQHRYGYLKFHIKNEFTGEILNA